MTVGKVGSGFFFCSFLVSSFARSAQHSAGCPRSSRGLCLAAVVCAVSNEVLCDFVYLVSATRHLELLQGVYFCDCESKYQIQSLYEV